MTMPYYVAPEQVMKDRAEYAQKGIARGRALVGHHLRRRRADRRREPVAARCTRSARSTTASRSPASASYNEFDQLRVAGVRHADTKGYAYSREDVDARSLANLYAQYLGQVFTHEMKPLEVEILVAELDPVGDAHQLYHIAYDGTVADEQRFTVLGGEADAITHRMAARFRQGWSLGEAIRGCVASLSGPTRTLRVGDLEVAVLEHGPWRRTFRRIGDEEVAEMLADGEPPELAAGGSGDGGQRRRGRGNRIRFAGRRCRRGTRLSSSVRRPLLNRRLEGFGTTIFAEMSALAAGMDAINLGQGFPDTDGPEAVTEGARAAIASGHNQYAPGIGVESLREAIAAHQQRFYGLEFDPGARGPGHDRSHRSHRRHDPGTVRARRLGGQLRAVLRLVCRLDRARRRRARGGALAAARLVLRPRTARRGHHRPDPPRVAQLTA